jgi:hypothetical protein
MTLSGRLNLHYVCFLSARQAVCWGADHVYLAELCAVDNLGLLLDHDRGLLDAALFEDHGRHGNVHGHSIFHWMPVLLHCPSHHLHHLQLHRLVVLEEDSVCLAGYCADQAHENL